MNSKPGVLSFKVPVVIGDIGINVISFDIALSPNSLTAVVLNVYS